MFTPTSDISGELLNLTNPLEIYHLQLEAGEHELIFTLIDENDYKETKSLLRQLNQIQRLSFTNLE